MIEKEETRTIEEQAFLFSVLADPTRLKLLKLLARQEENRAFCVNALAYQLGVTQSAISQHLRVLKSAGLVQGERRGYHIHYFINQEGLKNSLEQVTKVFSLDENTQKESAFGSTSQ
jgi:DNA-binding transcriptional ArsR family regulator